MRKYILRRYRGNGMIIPDIMRAKYQDYPPERKKPPSLLAEVMIKEISRQEYLEIKSSRLRRKRPNFTKLKK